jgi:hypothetical protein
MRNHRMPFVLVAASAVSFGCSGDPAEQEGSNGTHDADARTPRMPAYAADGALVRVEDWPDWIFLGSSINLNYLEVPAARDLLATVFMEPTAVDHFEAAGEFREGTMTALAVYEVETDAPPAQSGQFAGRLVAFEMSVKDSSRQRETKWAYYSFGLDGTIAQAQSAASCFACHDQSAETDHVFTQFYPRIP